MTRTMPEVAANAILTVWAAGVGRAARRAFARSRFDRIAGFEVVTPVLAGA